MPQSRSEPVSVESVGLESATAYLLPPVAVAPGGAPTSLSAGTITVGGSASGLSGALVVQDNGVDSLIVQADGTFVFPTLVSAGAAIVPIQQQPTGNRCTVANGTGVATADVSSLALTCVSPLESLLVARLTTQVRRQVRIFSARAASP